MKFQDLSQKVSCPYNESHIFDKQKLIFHLNRCKDKEKVGHKFTSCKHNRMHIILKENIQIHEESCPDRTQMTQLTGKLKKTAQQTQIERERSREKLKREQNRENQVKKEVKLQHDEDCVYFENCELCRYIMEKLQEMRQVVPPQTLAKIKKLEKYIKQNQKCTKAYQELQKSKEVRNSIQQSYRN